MHALRVFHSRSSILRVNYTILVDVFVRPGPGREFGFEVNVEGQQYRFQTCDSDADDEMGVGEQDVVEVVERAGTKRQSEELLNTWAAAPARRDPRSGAAQEREEP